MLKPLSPGVSKNKMSHFYPQSHQTMHTSTENTKEGTWPNPQPKHVRKLAKGGDPNCGSHVAQGAIADSIVAAGSLRL